MSQFRIRQPVIHIPFFKEYKVPLLFLRRQYLEWGVEIPFPPSDYEYYFTDIDGWAKILPDLIIKSNLYKENKQDCDWYARKAYVECCDRYGLNTLLYTYGTMPLGAHGFNSFWTGDGFLLFEPNEGYNTETVFGVGTYGYVPTHVLL